MSAIQPIDKNAVPLPDAVTPESVNEPTEQDKLPLDLNVWTELTGVGEGNYGFLAYTHVFKLPHDITWGPVVSATATGLKPTDGVLSAGVSISKNLGGENEVVTRILAGTTRFKDPALSGTAIFTAFLYPWGEDKPFFGPEVDVVAHARDIDLSAGAAIYVPVGGPFSPFIGPYITRSGGELSWSVVIGTNLYFDL